MARMHRQLTALALVSGGLLLTGHAKANGISERCQLAQTSMGFEMSLASSAGQTWQFDRPAFRSNAIADFFFTTQAQCQLSNRWRFKTRMASQAVLQKHQPGELEDKQRQMVWILNEAYLTWSARDNWFVDIGKVRKSSSNLFSVAPLDLLRNSTAALRTVRLNALGSGSRTFYDEGAWGLASSYYLANGSLEAAVLPRLTGNHHQLLSSVDWRSLERTNVSDRYYFSYTSNGLTSLTPTVSLLLGQQKTLALGLSSSIDDNWIVNWESSFSAGETWRHLHSDEAAQIQQYRYVQQPFTRRKQGVAADMGIGVRYTSRDQTEYGIEYYVQSQGYSRSQWRDFMQTVHFVNQHYADIFPYGVPAAIRQDYQQYAQLFAAQTDNVSRVGYLHGKNYLTLFAQSHHGQLRAINWQTSLMINLADSSGIANVALDSYLTNSLQLYSGISHSIGDGESEFGLYGRKGNVYAGMRILW